MIFLILKLDIYITDGSARVLSLKLISYNLHGLNQGFRQYQISYCICNPDVFILQEYWLTPNNLSKIKCIFPDYFHYGSSAMSSAVASGFLGGRSFGGVFFLINKNLLKCTSYVVSAKRCAALRINDCLLINGYLPCSGTPITSLIISYILFEV